MRFLIAALLLVLSGASALAQTREEEEEQQRCVWSCLAHSKGASDPAYERCVRKLCAGPETAAPKNRK